MPQCPPFVGTLLSMSSEPSCAQPCAFLLWVCPGVSLPQACVWQHDHPCAPVTLTWPVGSAPHTGNVGPQMGPRGWVQGGKCGALDGGSHSCLGNPLPCASVSPTGMWCRNNSHSPLWLLAYDKLVAVLLSWLWAAPCLSQGPGLQMSLTGVPGYPQPSICRPTKSEIAEAAGVA